MATMKAVRIHEYGATDVLRYEDAHLQVRAKARFSSAFTPPRSIPLTVLCGLAICLIALTTLCP
jgi:hypothetical protein